MKLLWLEIVKLRYQKRTWIGLIGLAVIPIIVTVAIYLSSGPGDGGPTALPFIAGALRNGIIIPIVSLFGLAPFLLPLAASMVGAFTIAGEWETGTLKTILGRPVRRGSLLAAKWGVALLYLFVALVLVFVVAVISGLIVFGIEDLVTPFFTYTVASALGLSFLSYLMALAVVASVVSLAVLFSAITGSSLTAAVIALVLVIVVQILLTFSYFDFLEPWVFTSYFTMWADLFQKPIVWEQIVRGLICTTAWSAALTGVAWWRFRRRDILI